MRAAVILLLGAIMLAPGVVSAGKKVLGLLGDRHLMVIQGRNMRCVVVDTLSGKSAPAISCVKFDGGAFSGPMFIIEESPE